MSTTIALPGPSQAVLRQRRQQMLVLDLIEHVRVGVNRQATVLEVQTALAAAVGAAMKMAKQEGLSLPGSTELRVRLLGAPRPYLEADALLAGQELGSMDGSEARASTRADRTGHPADCAVALVEFAARYGACPALVALRLARLMQPWTVALQVGCGLEPGGLQLFEALGGWSVERLCAPDAWRQLERHAGVDLQRAVGC